MRSRPDDVRKRIANRKRAREKQERKLQYQNLLVVSEEDDKAIIDRLPTYEVDPNGDDFHPLFRKEAFLFKVMASVCIVLIVAILYRNQSPSLDSARQFVKESMEKDFQFATVSAWYEDKFGKPLAFFPLPSEKNTEEDPLKDHQYALPASGRILEPFDENGQRIMIETEKAANVEAMNEGYVSFIGEKEGFENTVIITHADKSETWYGNLSDISVSLYQHIEKGKIVGKVSQGATDEKGAFYFAIKKDDDFIDPIQVIEFE